jgi:hypothetical protein
MEENQFMFDEIAKQVLENYELLEPRPTFIRHSDNITYV